MGADNNREPCRIADALSDYAKRLAPIQQRCMSVGEAWEQALPTALREHCRIVAITGGCLKVAVDDSSSYMCELQWCKVELLRELQRLCPGAAVRRLQFTVGGTNGGQ
jgi:hypothetical protein